MPDILDPKDLIPMDLFAGIESFKIDIVYAQKNHPENIFGIAAYHEKARMILHRDMARVVVLASRLLRDRHGWTLIMKDGLRPVEAQQRLIETDIVKQNPHWLTEPRLLSSPGQGAHPRGMAIDVSVEGVNMGTVFDAMVPESARAYTGFAKDILENRKKLETAFIDAGNTLNLPVLPLPSEWWDFRFQKDHVQRFEPIRDADLPDPLKICTARKSDPKWEDHLSQLAKSVLLSL